LLFSQVDLALARGDANEFDRLTKVFLGAADSRSSYELDLWALDRRVRSLLLNPQLGDPLGWGHPAMVLLRSARRLLRHLNERFRMSLLLLDFRLAALRYSVGILPEDDVYGKIVANLEKTSNTPKCDLSAVRKRGIRARRAAVMAMRRAKTLDTRWNCDWRRRGVEQRIDRIASLVEVVYANL
jgi:hypothetical protein